MTFEEICNNPADAGKRTFESGMSIHANPFRNKTGHGYEHMEWERGYKEARRQAKKNISSESNKT